MHLKLLISLILTISTIVTTFEFYRLTILWITGIILIKPEMYYKTDINEKSEKALRNLHVAFMGEDFTVPLRSCDRLKKKSWPREETISVSSFFIRNPRSLRNHL